MSAPALTPTPERAADAREAMGLSISDAIRLLMLRVADERRLPFDGKGQRFACVDEGMADLHADD